MILTTHALVGAAIGKNLNNPGIIIITAFVAHFILDSFRHGEYLDDRYSSAKEIGFKASVDLAIGFSIILFLIYLKNFSFNIMVNISLGSFFSLFPDLLTIMYWKFPGKLLGQIKKIHSFAHRYSRFPQYSVERKWTLRNARNDILFSLLAIALLLI